MRARMWTMTSAFLHVVDDVIIEVQKGRTSRSGSLQLQARAPAQSGVQA